MLALAFLLAQDALPPTVDAIGDALVPIGGAALIGLCIRLAVTAYKDSAAVAREREKVCTEALAGQVAATTALTAEVRKGHEDGGTRLEPIVRSLATNERGIETIGRGIQELLEHARRERG